MFESTEDDIDIESLKWSEECYTLIEFLEKLKPPQIVCVRDGYYDLEDITTLSTDQVLTLHSVNTCRMLKGMSEKNEEICIPTNIEGKVEVMPNKLPKMYNSVKAVSKDWPLMIMSLHNHAWLGLMAKDVLKLESVKRKTFKEFLCCSYVNKDGAVEIPLSYDACFQSYETPRCIKVNQIESHCKMPCSVKVYAKSPKKPNVDDPSEALDLSTIGKIQLVHAYNYQKIISSIRHKEKTSVMQIPIDLEITVKAALGAIERESNYQSICDRIHQKTELGKLAGMELDYVKMGNEGSYVDNIYDYIDFSQLEHLRQKKQIETGPEKSKKPAVPSRVHRPLLRHSDNTGIATETPSSTTTTTTTTTPTTTATTTPTAIPTPPQSPAKTENNSEIIIPDDLKSLKVEGVANCLRYLHMDMYVDKFIEEQIDGEMLLELNEEMLEQSLEVMNKLHQRKLLKLIKGWRPK